MFTLFPALILLSLTTFAHGHVSIWHPSMYGFNVTQQTFPYDNRPVAPLTNYTFEQWWFHGHLSYPPNPGDVFELPVGQTATTELACDKGATSYFASAPGGDVRQGDSPCPNSPLSAIHTTGFNDLTGCALAIAYKSDVTQVQPTDFTVFSVNQTCVWTRFTDFQVPVRMPPCPEGGCICAWFWIHSPDSGGEQNYMNGFKCNITGSTSNVALAPPQLPRRCGTDTPNGIPNPTPGNCTYGAKQPFYWFQQEQNNMLEGTYSPPFYTDLYNFRDGAQDDIFVDSYSSIPVPSVNQTTIPTPLSVFPGDSGSLIPSPSLLPPPLSNQTPNLGMSSSTPIPVPSIPVSSVSPPVSTPVTSSSSQVSSIPNSQVSSLPSLGSSSSDSEVIVTSTLTVTVFDSDASEPSSTPLPLIPEVTVTSTVVVTVFASAPSLTLLYLATNTAGSVPPPTQNNTDITHMNELIAQPPRASCGAKSDANMQRRSTFTTRLRKSKRNFSLWHIF